MPSYGATLPRGPALTWQAFKTNLHAMFFTPQTWYVNGSGDTRFSTNVPTGHCNGTNPQSYAAAGGTGTQTNLNCAFKDIRSFWTDGTFTNTTSNFPAWGYIGNGGDTYLVDCSGGALCRIGQNGPNSGDWYGLAGDPYDAGAPAPPAGTSGNHTKILGICTQISCNLTNLTQIQGGYAVNSAFSFTGTSFVDVQGFDITDHTNCQRASSNANFCNSSFPLDDYVKNGISLNNTTHDVTFTDLNIHGAAVACMSGAPGGNMTLLRVVMTGCPSSGWNMDDGTAQTGFGSLLISNSVLYGAGCAEEYPITGAVTMPWGTMGGMDNCSSQSSGGGYGDCIGTTTTTSPSPWGIDLEHNTIAACTQDGPDLLHVVGPGNSVKMNGNLFYGSMGQQAKIGAPQTTFTNNLINGNCNAMNQTSPAPLGMLTGYNTNSGFTADLCRAGGSTVAVAVSDAGPAVIAGNTIIAANYIGYEIDDPVGATCTSACVIKFQDNVNIGYPNSLGDPPGNGNNTTPVFLVTGTSVFSNAGSLYDHNASFTGSQPCPNTAFGETNALCTTPGLVDQSFHQTEYGNMAPASGSSSVVGAGIALAVLTLDNAGVTRPNPPSMGALEFAGGTPTVATPTFSPGAGSFGPAQSVTISTSTGGASLVYTTDGSTPTVTALSCTITHGTLYSGALTVSTSQTLNAIGCLASSNASSVGTAAYVINGAVANPTCTPAAGSFGSAQSITCSSSTGGSTTTCTINGSTPTHGSPACTAISVATSLTLKALSFETGWSDSSVVSNVYTITLPPPNATVFGTIKMMGTVHIP